MTFGQQLVDWTAMKSSSNQEDDIVNHVAVPGKHKVVSNLNKIHLVLLFEK